MPMSNTRGPDDDSGMSGRIADLVNRYRAAWEQGAQLSIEELLGQLPESHRSPLFTELLCLELDFRRQQAEQTACKEYCSRFPQYAAMVEAVFGKVNGDLATRAGAGPSASGDGAPGRGPAEKTVTGNGPVSEHTVHKELSTIAWAMLSGPAKSPGVRQNLTAEGFELLGMLGHGGMGVVYKAKEVALDRPVALKMILNADSATADHRARFTTEAQAAARLRHENIVRVYHFGETDGYPYIVLEYVDGATLKAYWDGQPQRPFQVASVVCTLAEAVQHAHDAKIIHRDLKPGNVLLAGASNDKLPTANGVLPTGVVPKIADFGLAKYLDEEAGRTVSGDILGTPEYMSPEQASSRDVTFATDVYGLGTILYYGLTGLAPFRGANKLDTLDLVRNQPPVSPRQLQPKLPIDIDTICLKCLEKDPGKRYATARELAEDLSCFLEGKPIKARPVGRTEVLIRWSKRNPMIASLGIALACALLISSIGGTALALWALRGERVALVNLTRALSAEKLAQANAEEARNNAEDAKHKEWLSRRKSYALSMSKAYEQDWKSGRLLEVLRRLDDQKSINEPSQLGFEWHYLAALCHLELQSLTELPHNVSTCAVSADGGWLAAGGADGTVQIWSLSTRRRRWSLKLHRGRVRGIAFSPDGEGLASVGSDGKLQIWKFRERTGIRSIAAHDSDVSNVAYSSDGKFLATASKDYTVKVWQADSGKQIHAFRGHNGFVQCALFVPHRPWVVSVGDDGTLRLWDITGRQEKRILAEGLGRLMCLAVSADGALIAAGGLDGHVKVWRLVSQELVLDKVWPHDQIRSVSFSPDGARLIGGISDGTARIWDLKSHEQLLLLGHKNQVLSAMYSPDGRTVVTATQDSIKIWDANRSQEVTPCMAHLGEVQSVAYSPDGQWLASGSSDHTVIVWDVERGEPYRTLSGHGGTVFGVSFAPDGKRLASASEDETVKIWSVESGVVERTLEGHGSAVYCAAWSPDGKILASGSQDGKLRLFDGAAGGLIELRPSSTGPVRAIAFSPDGRYLAWTGESNTVKVWDLPGKRETQTLVRPNPLRQSQPSGRTLAFSPDSRRLACGGDDLVIEIWDVMAGRQLFCLFGHDSQIDGVAYSRDGTRLASASLDGTVKVWDAMTAEEIFSLNGADHCGFRAVCFHPGGRQLACASLDGSVQIWDGTPETPSHRARRDALSLVQFLYSKGLSPSEVMVKVNSDGTVAEDIKRRALSMAGLYGRGLVERDATRVNKELFGQGLFRKEVLDRIRDMSRITPSVRLRALELAATFSEDAPALASSSWLVVRQPGASAADIGRAVRQAEAAYRLAPRSGSVPTTLGVAYFRAGRYEDAVKLLKAAEELYPSYPANLAVLSMSYLKLGRMDLAKSFAERLHRTMTLPQWANISDAHRFMREADDTLQKYRAGP
jgi:WD40 repeat protein/serine/threonine protein kinase